MRTFFLVPTTSESCMRVGMEVGLGLGLGWGMHASVFYKALWVYCTFCSLLGFRDGWSGRRLKNRKRPTSREDVTSPNMAAMLALAC